MGGIMKYRDIETIISILSTTEGLGEEEFQKYKKLILDLVRLSGYYMEEKTREA